MLLRNMLIIYISGFVSKSFKKSLRCERCKEQLTISKPLSKLQILKCSGVLTNASPDVIEVCIISKKILRSNMKDTKKKNALTILCLKALRNIQLSIFSSTDYLNHILEQSILEDHRHELIKLIIKKYLIVRLNHISVTKNDAIKRIRSLHSRLVIFKNQ